MGSGKGIELVPIPDTLVKIKVSVSNNQTSRTFDHIYTAKSF